MEDKQKENEQNENEPINWKKELLSWVLIIAVAYVLAFFITHVIIIKTEVISGSMISTLNVDDKVVGNRMAYWFKDPARGEIIFFEYPDDETKIYVKRIIGLPGETVEIIDGKVYVDGSLIEEDYLNEPMKKENFGPYNVPENSYFVMGDNRNISVDSRYWTNKFVTRDEICGKAWLRYYPSIDLVKTAEY